MVKINKELINDLNKYSNTCIRSLSYKVMNELYDCAVYAIESFYKDYQPKNTYISTSYDWKHGAPNGAPFYYKRHYTNLLKKSFRKIYPDFSSSRRTIRSGIELTPYNMDNIYSHGVTSQKGKEYYNTDPNLTNLVFNLVYSGYHGNPAMFGTGIATYKMSPSPLEIILKRRTSIVNNIESYLGNVKVDGGYTTIHN